MTVKSGKFFRFKFVVFDNVKQHFISYKWQYIFLLLLAILGLVFGFVSAASRMENISLSDLPDTTIVSFINKTISPFSFFFSRFFGVLGLIVLIYACGVASFLCFIPVLVVVYNSILLAINCSILINLYKLGGIIDVVFVFFPIHFVLLCVFIVWAAVCIKQSFECKKTGVGVFSSVFLSQHRACIMCCFALSILAIILETIVMHCVSSVIFIGVS